LWGGFQQSGAGRGYAGPIPESADPQWDQEKLFAQVTELLQEQGLLLQKGTIVDSTLISAPSSTKNAEKKRDPEAHSTKKGNTWHFGYKAHIGMDKDTGLVLVHTLKVTAANVHDVMMTAELLSGEEDTVYGDSGYLGAEKREEAVLRNNDGKRFGMKSIAVLPRQKTHPPVPKDKVPRSAKAEC